MKIFKKKTAQTSNEYYEAYKAEISGKVEKNSSSSLNKVLKLELLVVALGLFIMHQNGLSLELKKMYVAGNDVLPISIQSDSVAGNLAKIEIREDNYNDVLTQKVLDSELYAENLDIQSLIKLLKSEMKEKKELVSENRIIISQN